jgi:hypothetical protein
MIRYYERASYSEVDHKDTIFDFRQFTRYDYLETHGSGFNIKFGFIYRAAEWLRIGGAFHSPSWFGNMRDYWYADMSSLFDDGDNFYKPSPSGEYYYELTTPWRVMGSAAFIFGQNGLLSMDYEFADYSSARLDANDYGFTQENNTIEDSYSSGHHVRVGTEWRYDIFSFRGGFDWATSPYQNNINDGERMSFSLGTGLRQKFFFIDLAYVWSRTESDYYFYNTSAVQPNPVQNELITSSILLTLGAKF